MAAVTKIYIERAQLEYEKLLDDEYTKRSKELYDLYPDNLDIERAKKTVNELMPVIKAALGNIPNTIAYKGQSFDKCKKMEAIDVRVYLDVDCEAVTYQAVKDGLKSRLAGEYREKKTELSRWKLNAWKSLADNKGIPEFDFALRTQIPDPSTADINELHKSVAGENK